jgi:hypothetical protein
VLRLVRLCGFDLDIMLVERDDSDWSQAQSSLALAPGERFERAARFARRIQRLQGEVARSA